jgi:hypothetical protein
MRYEIWGEPGLELPEGWLDEDDAQELRDRITELEAQIAAQPAADNAPQAPSGGGVATPYDNNLSDLYCDIRDGKVGVAEFIEKIRAYAAPPANAQAPITNPGEEAMQRAAGELPVGYDMRICLENGAGWIEIDDAEGNELTLETDTEGMTNRINESIDIAVAHAAANSGAKS